MSGELKGQKFEISKERIVLGRHPNCDIILNDGAASSQHCYVARRGNRYILHDLNSTNGTQLNFQRVTEAELQPKQVIQVGATELMFDAPSSEIPSSVLASNTQVVIDDAPAIAAPKSFSSVSPFGARHLDNRGLWLAAFIVTGLLALTGLAFFLYAMFQ
ncbi:MAG: FHA domain-containing protein [Verrucomicrobia bacterium]|nr:FHA domain-containing protein [Verrucomicrobiota bacterium]MBU4248542.1 FHA domain-containing protein [Verrucomicrobiota bacterium]MBU4289779.1 FHA domain-containing protein [Verrucomicrobiota bacterium]MBU4429587.1 FHA domain-containing protein [Verrucomicrobiota bacterium]MBU4497324.1 FHA domain-containing protein [Verrucomicrobiota bacterium]